MNHFFTQAPTVSWSKWLWRRVSGQSVEPQLIPSTLPTKEFPVGPTGTRATKCLPLHAKEYSHFLMLYFYTQQDQTSLRLELPPSLVQDHLISGHWIGAELRDSDKKLIGLVICQHAGSFKGAPMGLISWLCVHPEWRHRGVTNVLLRAVYCFSQPKKIFWWRNDGMLKSPVPPVLSESHIQRRKGISQGTIKPVPASLIPQLQAVWLQEHPNGLVLLDSESNTRSIEAYEIVVNKELIYIALVTPTYERTISGQTWCEVVGWVRFGSSKSAYEDAFYLEQILDSVPYDWIDAPHSMPHLESKWTKAGVSSWCVMGLDVGTATPKPILPLHCA